MRSYLLQQLLLSTAELLTVAAVAPGGPYALVADAGSTGTRMYLFHMAEAAEDARRTGRINITDLGKGPALSSFQDSPSEAVATVKSQIDKAKGIIPEGLHPSVPVSIFATAGMRLVDVEKATAVYAGLKKGLLDSSFPFHHDSFQARTITGREEGVFALVAANYLSHHISADLQVLSPNLMGVLDLGGSSTQIAMPPLLDPGDHLAELLSERHMYVRSFLSFGMERMRHATYRHMVDEAHWAQRAKSAVANPCTFLGYREPGDVWRGTGDAVACQHAIAAVLKVEKRSCELTERKRTRRSTTEGVDCLPMRLVQSAKNLANPGTPRIFLISGYFFVTDFARWWLEHPEARLQNASGEQAAVQVMKNLTRKDGFVAPSIAELKAAAALLCSESWANINASASTPSGKHKATPAQKVPHRCFELNYIVTLLSVGYGFSDNARPFQFVEKLEGSDVEWSLGAFLMSRAPQTTNTGSFLWPGAGSVKEQWLMIPVVVMLVVTLLCFLRRRCSSSDLGDCLPIGEQLDKVA